MSKCYLVDTDTAKKVTDQRISGYLSIRIHSLGEVSMPMIMASVYALHLCAASHQRRAVRALNLNRNSVPCDAGIALHSISVPRADLDDRLACKSACQCSVHRLWAPYRHNIHRCHFLFTIELLDSKRRRAQKREVQQNPRSSAHGTPEPQLSELTRVLTPERLRTLSHGCFREDIVAATSPVKGADFREGARGCRSRRPEKEVGCLHVPKVKGKPPVSSYG